MPTNSGRKTLENITFSSDVNAGLWLDKYFQVGQKGRPANKDEEPKQWHFHQTTLINVPADYNYFFREWKKRIGEIGIQSREITIDGRLIVGLGGASVLENSISIHRTYGVPYIPGSALKGLAAHFAHKYLGEGWQDGAKYGNGSNPKTGTFHKLIFGSRDFAGFVVFYDALLCVEHNGGKLPFHREIMTVHHSDYYRDGSKPPADWDSPVPIPFVSASGKYLLAVGAPEGLEHLADKAIEILAEALKTEGVGAKTSSGYGRGHLEETAKEHAEKADVEEFVYYVNALRSNDVASQINNFYQEWKKSTLSNESRKLMAEAIINRIDKDWKGGKQKGWYQELAEFVHRGN